MFFPVGVPLSNEFHHGQLEGLDPFLVRGILVCFLDRDSVHNFLLESIDLLLVIVRNLHCFFSFSLVPTLGCSSARGGHFKLSFTRREMLLAKFLFPVSDHPFFV